MRKLFFSFLLVIATLQVVTYVFAAYTETVVMENNVFQAGTYALEVSSTDENNDGIGDTDSSFWSSSPVAAWVSPVNWAPGQTFNSRVFLRARGSIDIGSVKFAMRNINRTGQALDQEILLADAWYDRNGNGVEDNGEDLMPTFVGSFDTQTVNGEVTMAEIYAGMNGFSLELEPGIDVLPGSVTNAVLGGSNGTGKGLYLEWKLKPGIDMSFEGSKLEVDFHFESKYLN